MSHKSAGSHLEKAFEAGILKSMGSSPDKL
jgi:hypothetical protein